MPTIKHDYCEEHTESWVGVEIPAWIRVFDCRAGEADLMPRAPWGSALLGSERAEVALGLRTAEDHNATSLVSCSTYTDARKADEGEMARQLRNALREAEKFREEYEEAKKHVATDGGGGSCLYMPIAVEISNFGWGVIADRRTCVVRRFGYNAA